MARRPPDFAFMEMENPRDADDSVRGFDGTRICGTRVKVEMSNGRRKGGGADGGGRGDRGGGGSRGGGGGRDWYRSPRRSSRRSPSYFLPLMDPYGVVLENSHHGGTGQDIQGLAPGFSQVTFRMIGPYLYCCFHHFSFLLD